VSVEEEGQLWTNRHLSQFLVDLGLALVVTAVLVVGSQQEVRHWPGALPLDATALVLLAGSGLVLAARRLSPLPTYVASLGFAWLYLLAGHPPGPIYLAPFIALLTVVATSRPVTWATAAIVGTVLLAVAHIGTGGTPLTAGIWAGVWLLLTSLFAVWLLIRRRFAAEARARAELAKRTQDEEARRRTAEERLGIAREMHDVVGHSLAVISLQAGVAERLLESRPEEVRKSVAAIRKVSRDALSELRAELALLRGEGSPAERAPAPDLRGLPSLVASMREAGLQVQLEVDVDQQPVSEIVAAAVYRIAQESLTNVVRHAGAGTHTTVRVGFDGKDLQVEVVDDGRGSVGVPTGSGIDGMRERVAVLGGRFAAGSRPQGGFRVWASIPNPPR
jgi:signal transduction histidine kinase